MEPNLYTTTIIQYCVFPVCFPYVLCVWRYGQYQGANVFFITICLCRIIFLCRQLTDRNAIFEMNAYGFYSDSTVCEYMIAIVHSLLKKIVIFIKIQSWITGKKWTNKTGSNKSKATYIAFVIDRKICVTYAADSMWHRFCVQFRNICTDIGLCKRSITVEVITRTSNYSAHSRVIIQLCATLYKRAPLFWTIKPILKSTQTSIHNRR